MNAFNQLVPRLTRAFGRNSQENNDGAQPEFTLKPAYQVQETPEAWGVVVQLPGVAKENLEISAEEGQVTIRGRRSWQKPESWTALHRETVDAPYELVFEHDNALDTEKIHAELKNGVLRVSLPKAEALKPRKIAVS